MTRELEQVNREGIYISFAQFLDCLGRLEKVNVSLGLCGEESLGTKKAFEWHEFASKDPVYFEYDVVRMFARDDILCVYIIENTEPATYYVEI